MMTQEVNEMNVLDTVEKNAMKEDIPKFLPGDTVAIHLKVIEGDKERVQVFQGVVLQKRGSGTNATFTVRKVSNGVGVERVFPLHSPRITKIERLRAGKVRRSKLFYLRKLKGKAARIDEKR
jgi:large subunit ribosomal protein L19